MRFCKCTPCRVKLAWQQSTASSGIAKICIIIDLLSLASSTSSMTDDVSLYIESANTWITNFSDRIRSAHPKYVALTTCLCRCGLWVYPRIVRFWCERHDRNDWCHCKAPDFCITRWHWIGTPRSRVPCLWLFTVVATRFPLRRNLRL